MLVCVAEERKMAAMTANALLESALQLKGTGWRVASSSFDGRPLRMEIVLAHQRGAAVRCPLCGAECAAYDSVERRWRHLNFFQYRCELIAKVPRANCATHGVRVTELLCARVGSGFTLLVEAAVRVLAAERPASD